MPSDTGYGRTLYAVSVMWRDGKKRRLATFTVSAPQATADELEKGVEEAELAVLAFAIDDTDIEINDVLDFNVMKIEHTTIREILRSHAMCN